MKKYLNCNTALFLLSGLIVFYSARAEAGAVKRHFFEKKPNPISVPDPSTRCREIEMQVLPARQVDEWAYHLGGIAELEDFGNQLEEGFHPFTCLNTDKIDVSATLSDLSWRLKSELSKNKKDRPQFISKNPVFRKFPELIGSEALKQTKDLKWLIELLTFLKDYHQIPGHGERPVCVDPKFYLGLVESYARMKKAGGNYPPYQTFQLAYILGTHSSDWKKELERNGFTQPIVKDIRIPRTLNKEKGFLNALRRKHLDDRFVITLNTNGEMIVSSHEVRFSLGKTRKVIPGQSRVLIEVDPRGGVETKIVQNEPREFLVPQSVSLGEPRERTVGRGAHKQADAKFHIVPSPFDSMAPFKVSAVVHETEKKPLRIYSRLVPRLLVRDEVDDSKRELAIVTELNQRAQPGRNGVVLAQVMMDNGKEVMVSDLFEGTLLDAIQSGKLKSEDQFIEAFAHIASGFEYMHGEGWIHADAKLENVLAKGFGASNQGQASLTDFGNTVHLVRDAREDQENIQNLKWWPFSKKQRLNGTMGYFTPEYLDKVRDPSGDIFGLGMLMHYALNGGKVPWSIQARNVLVFWGNSRPYSNAIRAIETRYRASGNLLQHIIADCIAQDPALRPTATEVLRRLRALQIY